MSIERLMNAFELERRLLGAGELKCPLSAIVDAEKTFGLVFPPVYRHYLEHIHPNTETVVFGVKPDENGSMHRHSTVGATYEMRLRHNLPDGFVCVDLDYIWQHVLDCGSVNAAGETPVINWHRKGHRVAFPDFSTFYLERVDAVIYDRMLDKAETEGLSRKSLDAYFALHRALGFTNTEYKGLEEHWADLRAAAE